MMFKDVELLKLCRSYMNENDLVYALKELEDENSPNRYGGNEVEIEEKLGRKLFLKMDEAIGNETAVENELHFLLGFKYAVKLFGLLMPERQLTEMPYIELPKVEKVS